MPEQNLSVRRLATKTRARIVPTHRGAIHPASTQHDRGLPRAAWAHPAIFIGPQLVCDGEAQRANHEPDNVNPHPMPQNAGGNAA